MLTGIIFDIQRFALHDGPGIRTTVFFKGCSNKCGWCHNPESFSPELQIQFFRQRCAGCARCAEACPNGAHVVEGGTHVYYRDKCMHCGACAENCYVNALVATGRRVSVEDVMREVTEDAPYYQTSGGGVTLSGGEPVLQQSFTLDLLGALKAAGIHTVVQTAGNYPFILLKPMLPYIDIVMYDVKGMSGHIYSEYIFGDRTRMLDNLKLLDDITDKPIIVRTPVIEGVNATRDEIEEIARFIKPLKNLESYRLIPYHGLGRAKYEALDSSYKNTFATPSPATIASLESAAAKYAPVYNLEKGFI